MASLNRCCFIGNLTRDPESRTTTSGTQVVSFSIAVNEKYKDKETTEFIDVTAWSKLAEIISTYCSSGQLVYIEGRWTTERWTDKETGKERRSVKLTAEKLQMLGGKGDAQRQGGGDGDNGGGYSEPDFDSSQIPF